MCVKRQLNGCLKQQHTSFAYSTTADASGCSLSFSAEAAAPSANSGVQSSRGTQVFMVVTRGLPAVSVPVLSKTTVDILCMHSRGSPPLMRTPFWAPTPVPTIIAVGVAKAREHGQAIERTATAVKKATSRNSAESPKAFWVAAVPFKVQFDS